MTWPIRLLVLPIMIAMHGLLLIAFVVACAGSCWQWLRGSKC